MGDWKSSYATEVLSCAQEAHDVDACNTVKAEERDWMLENRENTRFSNKNLVDRFDDWSNYVADEGIILIFLMK
ncbi:hypothetical protein [Kosmotoga sp. DU53]|uniref:hypothetical protein n=1 Tax=Kosmotoga sp. DU53 TaxID=1310160 RepID=UPI001372BAB7|nr:hypothetical protein [Kosmotoga sp. DU53]